MSITYLDTSALVKRYVRESGSEEIRLWLPTQDVVGTAVITRAEMASALAKARRMRWLETEAARSAWNDFLEDWNSMAKIEVTQALVARAGELAWRHDLRGYDAVHLAAVNGWQEDVGEKIIFGTFDIDLWKSAKVSGLKVWPENLETFLAT